MELIRRVHLMKEASRQMRGRGLKIGLVPTMGSIHEGHLALIRDIKPMTDVVVVSIFVNPTQFNENADYERYPRDLTKDADMMIAEGVDYVFAPEAPDMYPNGPGTWVEVAELSERLEGVSRPGHFRGVATVVMKMLNIVQPTVAVFGRKDAQQLIVIKRMCRDLMLDVEILESSTQRAADGLALSSRNENLSPAERKTALAIPRAIEAAERVVTDGSGAAADILAAAGEVLEAEEGLRVDYVTLADANMLPVEAIEDVAWLLVAAWVGETRLIDNTLLRAPSPPAPAGG